MQLTPTRDELARPLAQELRRLGTRVLREDRGFTPAEWQEFTRLRAEFERVTGRGQRKRKRRKRDRRDGLD